MTNPSIPGTRLPRAARLGVLACALLALAPAWAGEASTAPRHAGKAVPAANFLVEWRVQPVGIAAPPGGIVITSGSAVVGGSSGYGPGAVVVGTARPAVPQSVRVANGREASIRFDTAETHLVYDMSYAAQSTSQSSTDASSQSSTSASGVTSGSTTGGSRSRSQSSDKGASGHDVVVHRVDGLRVTPRWTSGDTLEIDVELTHGAPGNPSGMSSADSRVSRDIDFHSTVRLGFDEWQTVASVGEGGGEELQVRVSWR